MFNNQWKLIFKYNFFKTNLKFNFLYNKKSNFSTNPNVNNLVQFDLISESKEIGLITIKNSPKRNALSLSIIQDLIQTLNKIDNDFILNKFPRVLILNTEGEIFSSGHDLKELALSDENKRKEIFSKICELMLLIQKINPIIIAEVQGLATAAGCQLAATCDLVVASSKSKFETPGVKIGLFCSTPSVPLSRAIGTKRAMQMLLTGESIDGKKALDWGLINEIVDVVELSNEEGRKKLRENSLKLAEKINKFSSETLGFGKKTFYKQSQDYDLEEAYKVASLGMCTNILFKDTQEGITAFLEKRKPNFNK